MKRTLLSDKKFYLILLWLVFTTIFAVWWMMLGMSHVKLLKELLPDQWLHWESQRRMLFWEGISWITLLVIGGLTSLYFLVKEKSHSLNLKTFFASFNHDVKTSLASLRLQTEALKEDLEEGNFNPPLLDRLISDTMRLQVQIENSLYMSARESQKVFLEDRALEALLKSAQMRWPQIKIHWNRNAALHVDERVFTTVINNLIQNALVHGGATEIFFEAQKKSEGWVSLSFKDNGKGFSGPRQKLGTLFFRPTSKSGTGMGLYICQELIRRMRGRMLIASSDGSDGTAAAEPSGFSGIIELKGALA
jgi:signal transduction histidine kinase